MTAFSSIFFVNRRKSYMMTATVMTIVLLPVLETLGRIALRDLTRPSLVTNRVVVTTDITCI